MLITSKSLNSDSWVFDVVKGLAALVVVIVVLALFKLIFVLTKLLLTWLSEPIEPRVSVFNWKAFLKSISDKSEVDSGIALLGLRKSW